MSATFHINAVKDQHYSLYRNSNPDAIAIYIISTMNYLNDYTKFFTKKQARKYWKKEQKRKRPFRDVQTF
ncbi:hypothetical protein J14TS2_26830 [Bacillus sp. J14TS2]|nr:hypothetical protein J14TS2_26830 [Bacillus sp. J14TS2]